MSERPVEILALPGKMHALFDEAISLRTSGNAEQIERDFLSRSLAAYAVMKMGGADATAATAALVDGGGDGGIDAAFYSPTTNTLWLVQSKYIHAGVGEPDLGEVTKFKTGVEFLLDGNLPAFAASKAWQKILSSIEAHLKNPSTRVRAVLCYSGLGLLAEDRKRLFEALKTKFSKDAEDDYFEFKSVNLTTLNDWITGGDEEPGVESVELELLRPGWVTRPFETIYGQISLDALKALYGLHGRKLVAANLRGFKGSTDVNDSIQETVGKEPNLFFYLNNGLTAYCARLEVNNIDRANAERKRLTAKGFAIINGAQTLGSIVKALEGVPAHDEPLGYAFIKIISVEKHPDDRAFADRISRTANFQNHVGLKDFAAAYPLHGQVARTLRQHDIQYHYKADEDTPEPDDENFNMDEALTACACLANTKDCDLVTRVAANRDSLRSLEQVFPAEELQRSRHERVFPMDLSARSLWRAVQAQRIVLPAMQAQSRAATGVARLFYAHARWIVLTAIFKRLKPDRGEDLALSEAEISALSQATADYAEKLLELCVAKGFASYDTGPGGVQTLRSPRDFQSVFKTQSDCQLLLEALKAEIWKNANAASPNGGADAGS